MSKIDPRQIRQDGATDGQGLFWDNVAGRWAPKTASSGGGGGAGWTEIGRIVPTATVMLQFTGIPSDYSEIYASVEGVNGASSALLTVGPVVDSSGGLVSTNLHQNAAAIERTGYVHVVRANSKVSYLTGALIATNPPPRANVGVLSTPIISIASGRLTGLQFQFNPGVSFLAGVGVIILYGRM